MATEHREPNEVRWVGTRPAHRGTQVAVSAFANFASTVIYTVPAGQTLFLCGFTAGFYSGAAGSWGILVWEDAVPAIVAHLLYCNSNAIESWGVCHTFWPPLEIPEGHRLRCEASAAGRSISAFIHGWVE